MLRVALIGPVAAGSSPVAPGGDTAFYVYADGGTAGADQAAEDAAARRLAERSHPVFVVSSD